MAVPRNGGRWTDALPRPVAFVLSGGASLGSIQAGMVGALSEAGIEPDIVVGVSVGALNGAVIAESPSVRTAADRLVNLWTSITRRDVFPARLASQAANVVRLGHLQPAGNLEALIRSTLRARSFSDMRLPLVVVASQVLTGHVSWLVEGRLLPALMATTAIPGIFPPVDVDGVPHWDGGTVANVPLQAALAHGAHSIVVLDAGDVCHLDRAPRGIPDGIVLAVTTAMRQRVLVEAPLVAQQVPVLYLPRPCVRSWSPLDLGRSASLIDPTWRLVENFIATADPPRPGTMMGEPHHHEPDDPRLPTLP
jgi:NTE family protein